MRLFGGGWFVFGALALAFEAALQRLDDRPEAHDAAGTGLGGVSGHGDPHV